MRIAIIGKFPPIQGGVSRRTYELSRRLAARGHDVHVITAASEVERDYRHSFGEDDEAWLRGLADRGVHVHRPSPLASEHRHIPYSASLESRLLGVALRVFSEARPDRVLGWYWHPHALVAHVAAKTFSLPYALLHAGSDVGRLAGHPDLNAVFRLALTDAEAVLSDGSERVRSALARHGLSDAARRLVSLRGNAALEPASDGPVFDPDRHADRSREHFARIVGASADAPLVARLAGATPSGGPRILVLGKIGEAKGTYDLIAALGRLRAEVDFTYECHAAGSAAELARFARAVVEAGIADRTALRAPVAPWKVDSLLARADVVPYLERSFSIDFHTPRIPREVLSAGRCLVASREAVSGSLLRPILRAGEHAIVVEDPRDIEALGGAMRAVLVDVAHRHRVARAGYVLSSALEDTLRATYPIDPIIVALESL